MAIFSIICFNQFCLSLIFRWSPSTLILYAAKAKAYGFVIFFVLFCFCPSANLAYCWPLKNSDVLKWISRVPHVNLISVKKFQNLVKMIVPLTFFFLQYQNKLRAVVVLFIEQKLELKSAYQMIEP